MSAKRTFLIYFSLIQSVVSFSQTFWKITDENGEQLLLTIVIDERKNEFEAFTRKNALKDIAGSFNYLLALSAGRIQYPEIIYIKGNTSRKADSVILTGTFYYVEKKFPFRAAIYRNNISGKFVDYRNRTNRINGIRIPDNRPINDYRFLVSSANSVTARYLFDRDWLRSDEWTDFSNRINELKAVISDDYEMRVSYYWLGRNLPFSPYEITRENNLKKQTASVRKMFIGEPEPETALIDAGMMPQSAMEMDSIAFLIEKAGSKKLVIDLRGRAMIEPVSAEYLLGYLSRIQFKGGIYLTRKYTDNNSSLPKADDYQKYFRSFTGEGYMPGEFRNETGRYFKISPISKTFKGEVYVLTDSRTSGVSSSLIYMLKKHKIAKIVGQRASVSAGISEKIALNKDFSLTLIVSGFKTPENRDLTADDLEPDIIVPSEDALKYVLKSR
jgi:hypothetical protein